jgi:hypothetical protein
MARDNIDKNPITMRLRLRMHSALVLSNPEENTLPRGCLHHPMSAQLNG